MTRRPGVNLVGFLEGELGLGEVPRRLARGLEAAGVPFVEISYRRPPSGGRPAGDPISRSPVFDTNIVCMNADYLHTLFDDAGVELFDGRHTIGVWFWETSVFREEDLAALRFVDEVWVASEYVQEVVAAATGMPVHLVPLPIEAPSPTRRTRAELGLPDGFMFLFVFDFVSAQRKNPMAVVEAFKLAFQPGEGPVLVLKGMNGRLRKPQLLDELLAAADGRPDIQVVDGYVSAEEKEAMIAACDCYVSLHRSEGFGLTMAEAMAHGKPVIATGYSGNLEFMDEENGYLVPSRLVPVPEAWWAYAPGAEWAEPDVGAAAALMREVAANPRAARERGERGRADVLDRMSLDRSAAFMTSRLADTSPPSLDGSRAPILRASAHVAGGVGAGLDHGSASRRPQGIVRRALRRALWPHLEEQHRFDSSVVDGLRALERRLDELERRIAALPPGPDDDAPR